MQIKKDLPIPKYYQRGRYNFLKDLKPQECLCFDDKKEFHRHMYAFRYYKIPFTTRSVETEKRIPRPDGEIETVPVREYRIWRL